MFEVPWSEYAPALWKGLQLTLLYTVIGFAGAAVFGLLLGLLRLSRNRILRVPAALYTEIFKNIPLLAIIFITYFGLASVGIKLACHRSGLAQPDRLLRGVPVRDLPGRDRRRTRRTAGGRRGARPRADQHLPARDLPAGTPAGAARHQHLLVDLLKSTSLLVTISAAELMSGGGSSRQRRSAPSRCTSSSRPSTSVSAIHCRRACSGWSARSVPAFR